MDETKALTPLKSNLAIELFKIGEEFKIDSRIVANGMGLQHEMFLKTLKKYKNEVERFGFFHFQSGKIDGRGRPESYVMLNRNQVAFALTLSRNTPQVVKFKVDLIEAFDIAVTREHLRLPHSTSNRFLIEPADTQQLILDYVARLQNPTARDLSRYLKRFTVKELRQWLHDLADQGLLAEWFTGHSYRYKIAPQKKLLKEASAVYQIA